MANSQRDQNRIPTLIGVSSSDGLTPVLLYADPITHRLLVDMGGSTGSGTVTSVAVTTANGVSGVVANPTTAAAITLTLGAITPTTVNGLTITTTTGTLTIAAAKTLTANAGIVLAGTDGKTLTLTNGLTVATNDGTLAFGAASKTLTVNNSLTLAGVDGKTLTNNNNLTLAGTDGTTMTFPTTSATIARTDAANTFTGVQTMSSPAITTPQIIGIATGTGVAITATASTLVLRDTSGNLRAVNLLGGLTSTVTAAGTTTLTNSSNLNQVFTGTTTQILALPVASGLANGQSYYVQNTSTGAVTVQTSGGNTLIVLAGLTSALISCVNTGGGTGIASWAVQYVGTFYASGKTLTVNNSLTLAGVDGKTLTNNNNLTLAGTDGKTLTLTNGLTVTTNDGTLAFGAASKTLTVSDSTTLNTNAITLGGGEVITFSPTNALSLLTTGSTVMTFPAATDTVATLAATQTVTNKRITRRNVTTTQSATPTINTDNTDIASITALAQAITSFTTNLSGTPLDGDMLMVRITDNGTARAITWGASFEASTVALPTTTVISTLLTVGFQYNGATSKWRCIATA